MWFLLIQLSLYLTPLLTSRGDNGMENSWGNNEILNSWPKGACDCDSDCVNNCSESVDGGICLSGTCGCTGDEDCLEAGGGSYCRGFGGSGLCGCRDEDDCQESNATGPRCEDEWQCNAGENTTTTKSTESTKPFTTFATTTVDATSTSSDSTEKTPNTTHYFPTHTTRASVLENKTTTDPPLWEGCTDNSDCPPTTPVCDEELKTCVEEWLGDVEDMIANGEGSLNISIALAGLIEESFNTNEGVSSGSIWKLGELMKEILDLRGNELVDHSDSLELDTRFTNNIVESVDVIFQSYTGWDLILDNSARYNTSAQYLRLLENLGTDFGERNKQERMSIMFKTNSVSMQIDIDDLDDPGEKCFEFDLGSICADMSKVNNKQLKDENVLVAGFVKTKMKDSEENSIIFPNQKEGYYENSRLGTGILSLSINGEPLIGKTFFLHTKFISRLYQDRTSCNFVPREPACVYLDLETASWSDRGCRSVPGGSKSQFGCECQHLTNFGILFDWRGSADAKDPGLSSLSYTCLTVSCFSILLAEVLHYFDKNEFDFFKRRRIDRHRNLTLLVAQLSFMTFVGLYGSVSCVTCEVLGSILHFLWLSVFVWTGLDGLSLYFSLVQVYPSCSLFHYLVLLLGYGVPFLIVVPVLVSGLILDSHNYLRRSYGNRVSGCCLGDTITLTLIIPAGLILIFNAGVSLVAVKVSYDSGKIRNIGEGERLMGAARNIVVLTFLLGLTWTVGFLPPTEGVEYIFVLINGSSGLFILLFTITSNKKAVNTIRKFVTRLTSSLKSETANLSSMRSKSLTSSNTSARSSRTLIRIKSITILLPEGSVVVIKEEKSSVV